ncbi:MAG: hypothetical protein WCN85_06070 [Burkholderiales bacterium]
MVIDAIGSTASAFFWKIASPVCWSITIATDERKSSGSSTSLNPIAWPIDRRAGSTDRGAYDTRAIRGEREDDDASFSEELPAAEREAEAVCAVEREAAAIWRGCAAVDLVVAAFAGAVDDTTDRVVTALVSAPTLVGATALVDAAVLRATGEGSPFLLAGLDDLVVAATA